MNLIYLRPGASKARKFLKKKLRAKGGASLYGMEAGDCCLAPAPGSRRDCLVTFLNDMSPGMFAFICRSGLRANLNQN
ncbi:MAG: hypothetical protein A2X35_04920 [Elusimicrobia bacterium GWA2_61_42]|nr:MAG: hypothetical protein A2X35_04920 [Elusimicrobia bacterium GWA2_61_42]OGR77854.1 MAG: hypothetical protein A2X38_00385 [Elusimicrobia bacterium GWC2_61_25]